MSEATWQVAHECVHLLDPCHVGEANVLEEGLATWFQDEERFHPDFVREFIREKRPQHPSNYKEAKSLVVECMPNLANAVRDIRAKGNRLCDFEPGLLTSLLPNINRFVVERLCTPFQIYTQRSL